MDILYTSFDNCVTLFNVFCFFFLMIRRPPRSTRTDTLFPYTTLFRSQVAHLRHLLQLFALHRAAVPADGPVRDARRHVQGAVQGRRDLARSEEHTSELQSLMRISYAVFCLKKKIKTEKHTS